MICFEIGSEVVMVNFAPSHHLIHLLRGQITENIPNIYPCGKGFCSNIIFSFGRPSGPRCAPRQIITGGIKGEMPAYGKALNEEDMRALISYPRKLGN